MLNLTRRLWQSACGSWCHATCSAEEQRSPLPQSGVFIVCDPSLSSLLVTESKEDISKLPPGNQRVATTVDWHALIRHDKKNQMGYPLRTGTRTRSVPCGRYTVRISGGFLNSSATGEMGVIVYAVVEVFRGSTPVVAPTALSSCDSDLPIYRRHAGGCPDGWALSIEIEKYEFGPQQILVFKREFLNEKRQEQRRVDRVLLP